MSFRSVVSVCCAKDLDVWTCAAPRVRDYITAQERILVVPDSEVVAFRRVTPKEFDIVAETEVIGNLASLVRGRLRDCQVNRTGWYIQQIAKVNAALRSKGSEILIWDADTVPLKPLTFNNDAGALLYYTGAEHHRPYFETLDRLLRRTECADRSFIAQCFPIRAEWLRAFIADVESTHGVPWVWAVLNSFNPAIAASFSEYETLGAYVHTHYPTHVGFQNGPWLRRGRSLLGSPRAEPYQLLTWQDGFRRRDPSLR